MYLNVAEIVECLLFTPKSTEKRYLLDICGIVFEVTLSSIHWKQSESGTKCGMKWEVIALLELWKAMASLINVQAWWIYNYCYFHVDVYYVLYPTYSQSNWFMHPLPAIPNFIDFFFIYYLSGILGGQQFRARCRLRESILQQ